MGTFFLKQPALDPSVTRYLCRDTRSTNYLVLGIRFRGHSKVNTRKM
jgi:hypothetical protein